MNKKTMKILAFVVTLFMVIAMMSSVVNAASGVNLTPNQITANIDSNSQTQIKSVGGKIVGIIQVIGIVIAVVVIMVVGIKYMMGSVEEKAEYKKTMMPYIIGAVLIFAGSTLANVVYQFATGIGA